MAQSILIYQCFKQNLSLGFIYEHDNTIPIGEEKLILLGETWAEGAGWEIAGPHPLPLYETKFTVYLFNLQAPEAQESGPTGWTGFHWF